MIVQVHGVLVQKSDKEKYVYSRYGIKLDSASSWSFSNDFARNVMIFRVDDSSSSCSDHRKKDF